MIKIEDGSFTGSIRLIEAIQNPNNRLVLQAVQDFPGRMLGYVIANPHYTEEIESSLNYYLDQPGMVAIKVQTPKYLSSFPNWSTAGE